MYLQLPKCTALILVLIVMNSLVACKDEPVPTAISQLISEYKEDPKDAPYEVWRYMYAGTTVYYMPPRCCDIPSKLYDENGKLLCKPDGGFTGRGNGKCPDFISEGEKRDLLWTNPIIYEQEK